ncbi:type IV pilin [Natrialbaceae archaeon A-arb3/5]
MDGKSIRNKLVGNDEKRAVSPVIGVILMVAITVILAAVIAMFVLDLGDTVGEEPNAGMNIEDTDTDNHTVSVTSMGNSDGVAVVDSGGEVIGTEDGGVGGEAYLNSSGSSLVVESDDSYTVVAYIGNTEEVEDHGLDEADSTATIGSIDD